MIDCYTWITDNGYKPRMMLEETGLPHKIIPVDLRKKAQMAPDFMKISPGHKIPAIVDHEGPGGAERSIRTERPWAPGPISSQRVPGASAGSRPRWQSHQSRPSSRPRSHSEAR